MFCLLGSQVCPLKLAAFESCQPCLHSLLSGSQFKGRNLQRGRVDDEDAPSNKFNKARSEGGAENSNKALSIFFVSCGILLTDSNWHLYFSFFNDKGQPQKKTKKTLRIIKCHDGF